MHCWNHIFNVISILFGYKFPWFGTQSVPKMFLCPFFIHLLHFSGIKPRDVPGGQGWLAEGCAQGQGWLAEGCAWGSGAAPAALLTTQMPSHFLLDAWHRQTVRHIFHFWNPSYSLARLLFVWGPGLAGILPIPDGHFHVVLRAVTTPCELT